MIGNKEGLLSVCCTSYNHAKFISSCIKSIWNSGYKNVEIIAVDDGSSDDSATVLKQLAKESPCPMQLILQENTGNVGYNSNQALKKASGEFVTFISLDDVLYPNAIEKALNLLQKDDKMAFVAPSVITGIYDDDLTSKETLPPLTIDSMTDVTVNDLLELEYNEFGSFYIQGCFWRKKIIDAVNGFDEDMTGDDIVIRTKVFLYLLKHPEYHFHILKEALCYYRRHANNVSKNGMRQIKIVTEYLDKYWPGRPNPDILIAWGKHVLQGIPVEKFYDFFSMNKRALSLISDKRIIEALKKHGQHCTTLLKIPFLLEIWKSKDFITKSKTLYLKVFCFKITLYKKVQALKK